MAKTNLTLLLFLVLLFSCKEKSKDQIEQSMKALRNTISLYKHDSENRGAFILNKSNLSEEKKREYRYDSVMNVQHKQEVEMVRLQIKLDSLENIYYKRYKK